MGVGQLAFRARLLACGDLRGRPLPWHRWAVRARLRWRPACNGALLMLCTLRMLRSLPMQMGVAMFDIRTDTPLFMSDGSEADKRLDQLVGDEQASLPMHCLIGPACAVLFLPKHQQQHFLQAAGPAGGCCCPCCPCCPDYCRRCRALVAPPLQRPGDPPWAAAWRSCLCNNALSPMRQQQHWLPWLLEPWRPRNSTSFTFGSSSKPGSRSL